MYVLENFIFHYSLNKLPNETLFDLENPVGVTADANLFTPVPNEIFKQNLSFTGFIKILLPIGETLK